MYRERKARILGNSRYENEIIAWQILFPGICKRYSSYSIVPEVNRGRRDVIRFSSLYGKYGEGFFRLGTRDAE